MSVLLAGIRLSHQKGFIVLILVGLGLITNQEGLGGGGSLHQHINLERLQNNPYNQKERKKNQPTMNRSNDTGMPKKAHNKEVMKEYSLDQLRLEGLVKLSIGDIVSLKGMAIKCKFEELAAKLRNAEKKILSVKIKKVPH